MSLTENEKRVQLEALKYVKNNKKVFINKFIINKNPWPSNILTFFMAGSPGAGKTEFSRRYVEALHRKTFSKIKEDKKIVELFNEVGIDLKCYDRPFICIDVDEIRELLPQYKKADIKKGVSGNAHVVQRAAGCGLDIVRKYCFDNNISFLHDGTFGNQYSTMRDLIKKSLKLNREVQVFYIYADPLIAWDFTQKREYLEGRNIKREGFIDQFFESMKNVDRAKTEFGKNIAVHCVLKDKKNKVEKIKFNEPSIAGFLEREYAKNSIKKYTKDDLITLLK
jgi:hypothetical protein